MGAKPTDDQRRSRLQAVVGLTLSALVLAAAMIVTFVFGLEMRTTYGQGVSPALGRQVVRDFLADQDAEAAALSKADESLIANRLTDSALIDVIAQIHNLANAGSPPTVSLQPSSITVLRAQDLNDPSLVIKVQEDGVKVLTTKPGPDSLPTQQAISIHGDFWLRDVSGHYSIADQNIQAQPASLLSQIALLSTALIWVGLAGLLILRTRSRPRLAPVTKVEEPASLPVGPAPLLTAPAEYFVPAARVLIKTFGGLQVVEGGKDWAPSLNSRPVMGFVWRRVLVAEVLDRKSPLTRDAASREANPGYDRETPLKRLRNLLHQGLPELPDALRGRLVAEPKVLRFEMTDCRVDAIDLLDVVAEATGRSLLPSALAARAQTAVEASTGVFLPEFETVEDVATNNRPTCTNLIRDLRVQLSAKRLALAIVLADTYLDGRRPEQAIAILESVRREHPDRLDLAERLAVAYRLAGRGAEARGLAEHRSD